MVPIGASCALKVQTKLLFYCARDANQVLVAATLDRRRNRTQLFMHQSVDPPLLKASVNLHVHLRGFKCAFLVTNDLVGYGRDVVTNGFTQ